MKKTIFVEVILIFAFCVLVACAIKLLAYVNTSMRFIDDIKNIDIDDITRQDITQQTNQYISTALSYGIPALVAAIATLAAMIIIAIKDFPVFKPLVDKFHAKREARKQASDAAKAEKAEADKKARIEKLTAELEELKKDE